MSDTGTTETLTGFDLWTPNDYSNFITISAAAIGSTLLVIFKSRCKNITLCWGLIGCIRDVKDETDDEENPEGAEGANNNPPQLPQPQAGDVAIVPNNP
tara:strand:- start:191 stop:487 length:297 start_codon:yes stop_codon:yes gene_type:complete